METWDDWDVIYCTKDYFVIRHCVRSSLHGFTAIFARFSISAQSYSTVCPTSPQNSLRYSAKSPSWSSPLLLPCSQNSHWSCSWPRFLTPDKTEALTLLSATFSSFACFAHLRAQFLLGTCAVRWGMRVIRWWKFWQWGNCHFSWSGGLKMAVRQRVWTWVFGLFTKTRQSLVMECEIISLILKVCFR